MSTAAVLHGSITKTKKIATVCLHRVIFMAAPVAVAATVAAFAVPFSLRQTDHSGFTKTLLDLVLLSFYMLYTQSLHLPL